MASEAASECPGVWQTWATETMLKSGGGAAAKLRTLKVLAIDDSRHTLALYKSALKGFGIGDCIDMVGSANAMAAIEEHTPDIVLLDYVLSPIDGLALTNRIRRSTNTKIARVPIIMITAKASRELLVAARQAGITECLVKPIVPADLHNRLVSVLERPRTFVRTQRYVGPDRRRHSLADYDGTERRQRADASPRTAF